MHRVFWLMLLAVIVAIYSEKCSSAEVAVLGGVTQFHAPSDGTYANANQAHSMQLTSPAIGIRWDSDRLPFNTSIGAQYTYFGTAKTDAYAVNVDAPYAGGYIPNSGGNCVGKCAPLSRWVMESDAQAVAFTVSKHIEGFSLEWGIAFYQTRTNGYVVHTEANPEWVWKYDSQDYIGRSQVFGLAYQKQRLSIRLQLWALNGPYKVERQAEAPAIFNDEQTWTLLAGYSF